MKKNFASFAFGCRVNAAEKEEINRRLLSLGFNYSEDNPEIYLINTCAVTQKAERETRQFIYQIRKKYPKAKIVITGCAATAWIKKGLKIKGVDEMIDNKNKENIDKNFTDNKSIKTSGFQNKKILSYSQLKSDKFLSSGRLLIKIQEGCQRFCTYCIVPYLRGKPKSERIKNLVSKIKFYENDIKEVILTAINTEAYGLDTGEKFTDLIKAIINETKIPRVGLGSINPWSVNDDFFDFYKKVLPDKRLVNFFHIPLQSGSNKILKLMKRGYTREEFMEKLNFLSRINPLAFIGTDIIVGFLEEDDHDFEETFNFLRVSPIYNFHIFRFSKREGTAAFFMAKKLKEPAVEIKLKRARLLADLSKIKYHKFLSKHIGKIFPALFLQKRIKDYQKVLLDNQVQAFIKTPKNRLGQIKFVKIEKIKNNELIGKLS